MSRALTKSARSGQFGYHVHNAFNESERAMRMNIVDIRNGLIGPINRVMHEGERVVLERRGKPVAALVSLEDLAAIEAMEDAADARAVRKARKEGGELIPWEQIKAELGIGIPRNTVQ